jgi:DNA-binding CsgD family transcriptional regulator
VAEALLAAPVGRQRQLDDLLCWVSELVAGNGRTAWVEGEPGIGKSTLVRPVATAAEAAGCQVFWATCDELSKAFPLVPLLEIFDRGPMGRGPISELLRSESAPGNRTDVVAAAAERLLVAVDELAVVAPTMIVIDDLQWADPSTITVLGRIARSVRQLPLLLVCVARPVPRREDLSALRRIVAPDAVIPLYGLSDDDVAELVAGVVGGTPGERLLRMADGAAGNPLYLTELVEALIRGRGLTVDDGRIDATNDATLGSLSGAISDRLEFLSAPVRAVMRFAALLGLEFSVSELAVVSGRRVHDLVPLLDEAILAGVLFDRGAELTFRHPLIRSALYEAMPVAMRAAWHRDAARALAADGAPAERVARQLLPTFELHDGSPPVDEWMVRWLADAGQQLVGQAPQAAIPLLRWALSGVPAGVAPHDLLACRLADALYRASDPVAAAEVAASALADVTRPDVLVDLHWTLAQCRAVDGRSGESIQALESALAMPGVEPRHRARLLVLTARTYRSLGQVDVATEKADEALRAAIAADDRWATGWALAMQAILHGARSESGKALPLYNRALAVVEGDPAMADLRLMLQLNQAAALGDLDRYDAAIIAAEQVRQLADESGNLIRLAQAQSVLGELLFDVGRWDDALAEVDLDVNLLKDPAVECNDRGLAATIQLHRGHTDAWRHLADADRFAARLGNRIIVSFALAKSLAREHADAPIEALEILMDRLSGPVEDLEETANLVPDAVRLAVAVEDKSSVNRLLEIAEDGLQISEVPHMRAVVPHCQGLRDRDPERLLEAADHYEVSGRMLPRAQALEAAGVAWAERGDTSKARAQFTHAFSLYSELGASWDLARTQATFRVYGIRRGPHVRHRQANQGWDSLTPTELKIVGLVAKGMSNPQIAAQLFLSRRTVQTHVSHILAKLDLKSRIDIAREASRRSVTADLAPDGPDDF